MILRWIKVPTAETYIIDFSYEGDAPIVSYPNIGGTDCLSGDQNLNSQLWEGSSDNYLCTSVVNVLNVNVFITIRGVNFFGSGSASESVLLNSNSGFLFNHFLLLFFVY